MQLFVTPYHFNYLFVNLHAFCCLMTIRINSFRWACVEAFGLYRLQKQRLLWAVLGGFAQLLRSREVYQVAVPEITRCVWVGDDDERSVRWRVTVQWRHGDDVPVTVHCTVAKCPSGHAQRRRRLFPLVSAGAREGNSPRSRRHATRRKLIK